MPFFSVVIPTLNESSTICALLEDLKKQTFRDFEVIVIDGKSEDNTVSLVQDYKKSISISVYNSEKRNLCFQKNYGAKKATGNFLIFFDADVRISTEYLHEIYNEIQKSQVDFLTTYQLPDEDNSLDVFLVEIANITLEMLLAIHKQMAPGYNLIILRTIFLELKGFDEKAVFSEDHELSMRVWKQKRKKLTIIRKHLLQWSFRRLRKDGRLSVIYKYSLATLHMLFIGKITDPMFTYPMGGSYFANLSQKNKMKYLEKFKKEIKKLIDTNVISR